MFISPSADPIVCWHQARLHRAILQCPELLSQQSDDFIGPDEFITHHKPATMSKLSWLAADWPPPVLLHGLTRRSGRYCLASLPDSEVVEGDKRAAEDEKDALGIRSLILETTGHQDREAHGTHHRCCPSPITHH